MKYIKNMILIFLLGSFLAGCSVILRKVALVNIEQSVSYEKNVERNTYDKENFDDNSDQRNADSRGRYSTN